MRPSLSGRVGDSMVKLYEDGIYLRGGSEVVPAAEAAERGITQTPEDAKRGTIAYSILQAHNTSGDPEALKIRFEPRHHLCRHHPNGACLGHGAVPAALRAHQLP